MRGDGRYPERRDDVAAIKHFRRRALEAEASCERLREQVKALESALRKERGDAREAGQAIARAALATGPLTELGDRL